MNCNILGIFCSTLYFFDNTIVTLVSSVSYVFYTTNNTICNGLKLLSANYNTTLTFIIPEPVPLFVVNL